MDSRGYQTYKTQSVTTMTSEEMLLLLYDEMGKRLARAGIALEKQDFVLFDQSVTRTREIVEYLIKTLNFDYPVSRELKRMYDFFLFDLARLEAGRHPEIVPELKELVKELRDAFAAVSQSQPAHM